MADPRPDIAAPILVGGFVFAADLVRALSRHGLDLQVDILWLRSYSAKRESGGTVSMILGPNEAARGKHVLVIDGVRRRVQVEKPQRRADQGIDNALEKLRMIQRRGKMQQQQR